MGSQCQRRIVFPLFGLNKKDGFQVVVVHKKNKKIHTTNTPVKKNHKVCGKNNCDKSRRASKIFELLVFHRMIFSDLITLSAFCQKHRKKPTSIFGATCKIFANNLGAWHAAYKLISHALG